jgi:hypothetical protein
MYRKVVNAESALSAPRCPCIRSLQAEFRGLRTINVIRLRKERSFFPRIRKKDKIAKALSDARRRTACCNSTT